MRWNRWTFYQHFHQKLSKIMASLFWIRLCLVFFLFIYIFIKALYCTLGFTFASATKKSLCGFLVQKYFKIKEFWSHSLQLKELHYILLVLYIKWNSCLYFLQICLNSKSKLVHNTKDDCNRLTSLNKTNIHSLPQKSLFTFSMVRVWINSWMKLVVLLPDFSWSKYEGRQEWNNSQNLQNIFAFNLEWIHPHFYLQVERWGTS